MQARDVLGLLRLENGRRWLDAAEDWQRGDALAVLEGERPYSFLTRSRGGSKTTDLAACALSELLVADAPLRCYWLAADSDQGALALDCIAGFVGRTPTLLDRVEVQAESVRFDLKTLSFDGRISGRTLSGAVFDKAAGVPSGQFVLTRIDPIPQQVVP